MKKENAQNWKLQERGFIKSNTQKKTESNEIIRITYKNQLHFYQESAVLNVMAVVYIYLMNLTLVTEDYNKNQN